MDTWIEIVDKVGTKYKGFIASYSETAVCLVDGYDMLHNPFRKKAMINLKDVLSIQQTHEKLLKA
ncbi:hypothetical protein M0R72_14920 [Candidatus Pacearchaeota archaeon]|nr:hypothetical protein [Candidatus Pacearchaeota archaeon]